MMTEKYKSILGIMGIIITLSGVFLYWGVSIYQKNMTRSILQTAKQTGLIIDSLIQTTNALYSARLDGILRDREVLEAFHARDRNRLYLAAAPWHEKFKEDNPYYANMHFHLPSGFSFLRMHRPREYGDDLSTLRPVITELHRTKIAQHAYEVGKHGLFFRVATPIFRNQAYIGALEIGIRVDETIQRINTLLGLKTARVTDKAHVNPDFITARASEIRKDNLFINPFGNATFFKKAIPVYDFAIHEPQIVPFDTHMYAMFPAGQLKNFKDQSIASLLVAQNISLEIRQYKEFIEHSIALTCILIVGAYVLLHFSFGSMIQKIVELNKSLETKVRQRTHDLEETGRRLKQTNTELNQIFNTAADGMRIITSDFNVLRVNTTFTKIMGQPREELEGRRCHEWLKGPFCFTEACTLKRILNGETEIEMEVERELAPNDVRFFLLTATPYYSAGGEVIGVVENFKDITLKKKAVQELAEKEEYLKAIMATVQAGVLVTEDRRPRILNANPYAAKLIGCSMEDLIHSRPDDYFRLEKSWVTPAPAPGVQFEKEDCQLTTASGKTLTVRLSISSFSIRGTTYLVQSFFDITDMKTMLKKQTVDITKAKTIMTLVNNQLPRYCDLPSGDRLFACSLSLPCHQEGGDHCFIRHLNDLPGAPKRTVISLKDQSGHEVNCILRSIFTDLIHNAILFNTRTLVAEEVMTRLNDYICSTGFFREDDFFTSITGHLDHHSLMLTMVCSGHPPLLLIRGNTVTSHPAPGEANNLPIPFIKGTTYLASQLRLQPGDQLVLYTDGLLEMPLKKTGAVLTTDKLCRMTRDLISRKDQPRIPVSRLIKDLLDRVAGLSGEVLIPEAPGRDSVNTSLDDVTLVGMEIEPADPVDSAVFRFSSLEEISPAVDRLCSDILSFPGLHLTHLEKRIRMALEESLINAAKHGNRLDPHKEVTVRWQIHNDLVIEVMDQGEGFDPDQVPDPTQEENLLETDGRGLFIVRHFSDHVQFRDRGRHIIISFRQIPELDDRQEKTDQKTPIQLWNKTT